MRLDALTVEIRPRHPYEAADLGVRLIADNVGYLAKFWALSFLPVLLLALALDTLDKGGWGAILLWWLKPWYDYGMLWVLSRRVFGDAPGWRDFLRAWPGFFRTGLPGALLIRRLSWSRAYLMPVRLLEGLQGKALNDRIVLLRRDQTRKARMIFQVFSLIEVAMELGLFGLILLLAPSFIHVHDLFGVLDSSPGTAGHAAVLLLYGTAVSLVEPMYVAAGFMLYLNRRTQLEAWDIELGLRRMAGRRQDRGS